MSLVLVGMVGGCDSVNLSTGPVAVRTKDGSLEVAVCRDIRSEGVLVFERLIAARGEWFERWSGEGALPLERGSIVTASEVRAGFGPGAVVEDLKLPAGGAISVAIYGDPEHKEDNIVGSFVLGSNPVAENRWLHPDGAYTTEPCTGY